MQSNGFSVVKPGSHPYDVCFVFNRSQNSPGDSRWVSMHSTNDLCSLCLVQDEFQKPGAELDLGVGRLGVERLSVGHASGGRRLGHDADVVDGPGQLLRVPRLLRVRPAADPAVPVRSPRLLQLPAQTVLLSHLQGAPRSVLQPVVGGLKNGLNNSTNPTELPPTRHQKSIQNGNQLNRCSQ